MNKEIKGKRIILREQREEDAPFFAYWFNQPQVMFQCGFEKPTDEDPKMQHKGYGTEAIRIMLDMAFNKYEMHRVSIGVVGLNTDALEFYKKIGFKQEGILEEAYYYNNEYSDFIMMRILSHEWK